MNNITENILKKIKDGEVEMQPRWHFVLHTTLMVCGVFLVALIAIYLFSFVLFTLHKSGLWFAPQYGHKGLLLLVMGSPWLILSILGIFLLVLYVLVSHYSFSYRKPLVYSIVGVVFFVISVSSVIQYFGIHDRMQAFVEQRGVPGLVPLYRDHEKRRPSGVVVGTISSVTEDSFVLLTDRDEELIVVVTDKTKTPPDLILLIDTEVLVFGDRTKNIVSAFGIKPAKEGKFRNTPPRSMEQRR